MARTLGQRMRSLAGMLALRWRQPAAARVITAVRRERLTYLEPGALADLHNSIMRLEAEDRTGIVVEAGCALGGSAIVMAAAKAPKRPFHVFDTFEQIPPPSEKDDFHAKQRYDTIVSGRATGIRGGVYYGYVPDLLTRVRQSFENYGLPVEKNAISLVQGLFEHTMLHDDPVAFAHIDCDWYDSVMTCLASIVPRLVPGGELVIDDYDDWAGARQAVETYFSEKKEGFVWTRKSRLHITRRPV